MRRHLPLLPVVVLALAATGCATSGVLGSHVARGVDFTAYRTFDWGAADPLPVSDPRFEANASLTDHVYGAVERGLQLRGLERATGDPDLVVHYHATAQDRLVAEFTGTNAPSCSGLDCRTHLQRVDTGTLVLDVVDARSRRIVWRGWVQDDAREMLRHPERVSKAVGRLLDQLPPCGTGADGGR